MHQIEDDRCQLHNKSTQRTKANDVFPEVLPPTKARLLVSFFILWTTNHARVKHDIAIYLKNVFLRMIVSEHIDLIKYYSYTVTIVLKMKQQGLCQQQPFPKHISLCH